MKNVFNVLVLIIIKFNVVAQVNYENTYTLQPGPIGKEWFLTNIGNNDYKYVIYDYDSAKFSLYNLDHSPYILDIPVPLLSDASVNVYYQLGYITTTLFDCDSTNLEYALMLNSPSVLKQPNFAVYRTDGTLIFSKDSVGTMFSVGLGAGSYEIQPIMNTPDGAKIFLFNNFNSNNATSIFVYGVCGNVPQSISEISNNGILISVFPNPTSHEINFEFKSEISPNDIYQITIFNSNFQSVKTASISKDKSQLVFEAHPLSSGIYFYSIQNKSKIVQQGKFIISK